jgi:hypothetical protein
MSVTIVTVSLTLALNSFGLGHAPAQHQDLTFKYMVPPGPGDGWGFPNGNPDGYGWVDYGVFLPLGADRTAEYYFPRFLSAPPSQMFTQTYFNPFETRGQRYIPFCGAGGDHPMGGPPVASSHLPVSPFAEIRDDVPVVRIPRLSGRVEAPPLPSGGSGLTP